MIGVTSVSSQNSPDRVKVQIAEREENISKSDEN